MQCAGPLAAFWMVSACMLAWILEIFTSICVFRYLRLLHGVCCIKCYASAWCALHALHLAINGLLWHESVHFSFNRCQHSSRALVRRVAMMTGINSSRHLQSVNDCSVIPPSNWHLSFGRCTHLLGLSSRAWVAVMMSDMVKLSVS